MAEAPQEDLVLDRKHDDDDDDDDGNAMVIPRFSATQFAAKVKKRRPLCKRGWTKMKGLWQFWLPKDLLFLMQKIMSLHGKVVSWHFMILSAPKQKIESRHVIKPTSNLDESWYLPEKIAQGK